MSVRAGVWFFRCIISMHEPGEWQLLWSGCLVEMCCRCLSLSRWYVYGKCSDVFLRPVRQMFCLFSLHINMGGPNLAACGRKKNKKQKKTGKRTHWGVQIKYALRCQRKATHADDERLNIVHEVSIIACNRCMYSSMQAQHSKLNKVEIFKVQSSRNTSVLWRFVRGFRKTNGRRRTKPKNISLIFSGTYVANVRQYIHKVYLFR